MWVGTRQREARWRISPAYTINAVAVVPVRALPNDWLGPIVVALGDCRCVRWPARYPRRPATNVAVFVGAAPNPCPIPRPMTTDTPNPAPAPLRSVETAPASEASTKSIKKKASLTRRLMNGITKLFGKPATQDDAPPAVVEVVEPGGRRVQPAGWLADRDTADAATATPRTDAQPASTLAEPPVQAFQTRRTAPREALYHVVTRDIPWSYGMDRVTVIARDPDLCYAYWDVTDAGIDDACARLGAAANVHLRFVLRVYDTTGCEFTGDNANSYIDIDIERGARGYYFSPNRPGAAVIVEIGLLSPEGYFKAIARSGEVWMPRAGLAGEAPVDWLQVEADTRLLRRRPFRFGQPRDSEDAEGFAAADLGADEVLLGAGTHTEAILSRLVGMRESRTVSREALGSEARLAERVDRIGRLRNEDAGASQHAGASEQVYAGSSEQLYAGSSEQVYASASDRRAP